MSNTANNVSAAKPRTTGAIAVAPVGTTLPTTANETLGSAFKYLGYISEDGTSEDITKSTTKTKAWGGDVVLVTEDNFENTFKFKLLEVLNLDVLKFAFGSSNVSGTLSTGVTVSKKRGNDTPVSIVIDTILTGDVLKRTVIPSGTLSAIGTIVQKANETISLECTVDCTTDSSGNTSYDYYKESTSIAKLSALTIGSLTLTPTFDADTTAYTASTSNTSDVITATPADSATAVIKNGSTTVTSGSAATWESGTNTVTVTVSKTGSTSRTYTVTVTKS